MAIRRCRRPLTGATPVRALRSGEGDRAAGLPLTIHIAAKRSLATVSALQDPAAKALVAVLPAADECDRERAYESVAVPFAPAAAIGFTRDSDHAVPLGVLPIRPSVD